MSASLSDVLTQTEPTRAVVHAAASTLAQAEGIERTLAAIPAAHPDALIAQQELPSARDAKRYAMREDRIARDAHEGKRAEARAAILSGRRAGRADAVKRLHGELLRAIRAADALTAYDDATSALLDGAAVAPHGWGTLSDRVAEWRRLMEAEELL